MEIKTAEQLQVEWNAVWRSPLQHAVSIGRRFYNRFLKREILPHAGSDKRLLEIGCGTASLLCDLSASFQEAVGLDISEAAIDGATKRATQRKLSNVKFVNGNCFSLPFEDDSFDVVWSQGLHEHFPNYIDILREELRVCAVGGYVLAGIPYKYSYTMLWYHLSRITNCPRIWPWTEQVFFKGDEILAVARKLDPMAEVHVMPPWALGILILKIHKVGSSGMVSTSA
jgi:ubiquinone/menaquinone biosynthesis C-methylase UbiE